MTKWEEDTIHLIAIFLWWSGGIAGGWCTGVLIATAEKVEV
jgi:hypothetical protein